MSDKLKVRECTRCGAEMCLESSDTEFYLCPECGTYFDDEYFDSMEAAIAYWNKRPYIDSLIARAEKAKAERDEARTMAERLAEAGSPGSRASTSAFRKTTPSAAFVGWSVSTWIRP